MAGSRKRTRIDMSKADPRVCLLPKGAGIPKRNLKEELDAQGLTQEAFAAWMGTDRTTVSKWISGARYMTDESIVDASFKLRRSPMYLLDLTGSRIPKPEDEECYRERREMIVRMVIDANDPVEYVGSDFPGFGPEGELRRYSVATFIESDKGNAVVRVEQREGDPLNYPDGDGITCDFGDKVYDPFDANSDPEKYRNELVDKLVNKIWGDYRDLGGVSHLLLDRINSRGGNQADELLERMWCSLLEK